ncbi:hypothetical protein DLAC_02474 [Tieghemostelium lacteum]|uniref:4E-binding protein n=1 Tax=Tieghemostelium lacteum TaxID=361077 RepID=A0A152A350_TIELA|nr:hypothetical protein DLAC_02474 [Tieghemostelium lacteum]|eukprot:KYR00471.1 hypothetical protein DLAC_02474 [Tieghemostelium lacteum]
MSSTTKAIPVLKDNRLNDINFSTSLGGTLYGTTPGGTKKIYDRTQLLNYRNSPLSKTPPPEISNFNDLIKQKPSTSNNSTNTNSTTTTPPTNTTPVPKSSKPDHDEMFQME